MSTENGTVPVRVATRRIETIRKRVQYLEEKLAWTGKGQESHEAQEAAALKWALPVLEAERDSLMRLHKAVNDHERATAYLAAAEEKQARTAAAHEAYLAERATRGRGRNRARTDR